MIDRTQRQFWLRPETLLGAGGFSGALFAAVPVVAGLCCVGGLIAYGVVWLVMVALFLAGCAIAACGVVVGLVGLGEGDGGKGFGGLVLLAVGVLVLAIFAGAFPSMRDAADAALATCLERGETVFQDVFLAYGCYAWPWAVVVFALAAAGVVGLTIGCLQLGRDLGRRWRRVHYACPRCYYRGLPAVRCPGCSNLVTGLGPSAYGVWHARCGHCSRALPTVDLLGRDRLDQACCGCSQDLGVPGLGRHGEYHIGLVGAASSGKSVWLGASLAELASSFAPRHGLVLKRDAGRPAASADGAATVSLEPSSGRGSILYLYDPPGRDFEEEARLAAHRFHGHTDGFVFLLDPFAEEKVRHHVARKYGSTSVMDPVCPAAGDALGVLSRLVGAVERAVGAAPGAVLPFPLAVAVTKAEGSALYSRVGEPAVPGHDVADGVVGSELAERRSATVRAFLQEQIGAGAFVRLAESRFARVAYFTAGATRPAPDPLAAERAGSSAPLVWMGRQIGAISW